MTINTTIPDSPLVGVQQYDIQDPTGAGSPGVIVPPAVVQMLMKTSTALSPKPSAPPPHPQVTSTTSAIAGGLQVSFSQLVSPTPYLNQVVSYRIYRNRSTNTFSGSQLIRTIPHDNSASQKTVTVQDLIGSNQSAAYFVTTVDSTGQESSQPGAFQSATVNSGTFNPNVRQASGGNGTTTNSAVYAVISGVTITFTTKGNSVLLLASCTVLFTAGATASFAIFRDGSQVSGDYIVIGAINAETTVTLNYLDSPSASSHTFDLRWKSITSTTITAEGSPNIQGIELG